MADARTLRNCAGAVVDTVIGLPWYFLLPATAMLARVFSSGDRSRLPRVLVGTTPLPSVIHNVRAMRAAGYRCDSAVTELYSALGADKFDHVLCNPNAERGLVNFIRYRLAAYWFFTTALWRYDVFHFFFDGGILRHTALALFELPLLKIAGKASVVMPYGSDAFVYGKIPNGVWRHALNASYPDMGRRADKIERRVQSLCRHADAVLGCLVHFVCLPRWDMLPLVCYPTNVAETPIALPSVAGPVRIAHATNHRAAKGTDFIIDTMRQLQDAGHRIEFDLIECAPHEDAQARIMRADVVIEQLYFGYGLTALEAMAHGKIVVSALDADREHRLFRLFSCLDECPIVQASPETLAAVLIDLFNDREAWTKLGKRMREFAEKYHSYDAASEMWRAIHRKIWLGEDVDLINYYRPTDACKARS